MELIQNQYLNMSDDEFLLFQQLVKAPYKPRTKTEFDLMCDLGAEAHIIEDTGGLGPVHAIAARGYKFKEDGTPGFPPRELIKRTPQEREDFKAELEMELGVSMRTDGNFKGRTQH